MNYYIPIYSQTEPQKRMNKEMNEKLTLKFPLLCKRDAVSKVKENTTNWPITNHVVNLIIYEKVNLNTITI